MTTVQHVIARWSVQPQHCDRIREILSLVAQRSEEEPWCISFTVLESTTEPGSFVLLEKYLGEDGHKKHMEAATFQELVLGQAVQMLTSRAVHYYKAVP